MTVGLRDLLIWSWVLECRHVLNLDRRVVQASFSTLSRDGALCFFEGAPPFRQELPWFSAGFICGLRGMGLKEA